MLKARQKLGKYRIRQRLAQGGFAEVYEAEDTVEGIRVALKIPYSQHLDPNTLAQFRREVRLTASLDHPNVLPIKNAEFIDGTFVITSPLGEGTLADRLDRRMSTERVLSYADQIIEAVAYAHERRVIHCDIKPENLILFPGDRVRLTDFGIARVALRTLSASGSGTIGYLAPEQAMGKPSFRSDVFSIALIVYRMLSGVLPKWPFDWPPSRIERVRRRVHPDLIGLLERALDVDERRRYADATRLRAAWRRLRKRGRSESPARKRRRANGRKPRDWRRIREREFVRSYRNLLNLRSVCPRCKGVVGEPMRACPWCGIDLRVWKGPTSFPARCPRCARGRKLDWRFCGHCWGGRFRNVSDRVWSDVRYEGRCTNDDCRRKDLMPFLRYCPWCRTKVRRRWTLPRTNDRCRRCGWGVAKDFWEYCPWCTRALERKA